MGLFNLFKSAKTVVVVDGISLNESLGSKGKVPPRNQLQILRRLSRFAQREKLEVLVVLSGSPLHKAPARKKFEEVTVLYSKTMETHAKFVVNTARSKGQGVILVTDSKAVDKIAGSGLRTMRISTFRKAFDASGPDSDSPDRSSGGNRSGRKPRRRPQKPAPEKSPAAQPKKSSEADAINELIDLVD